MENAPSHFGDDVDGARRDDFSHPAQLDECGAQEGVAGEDGGDVIPSAVDRLSSAPEGPGVDDVVVEEAGGVDEFGGDGGASEGPRLCPDAAAKVEDQTGPRSLCRGSECEMTGCLPDSSGPFRFREIFREEPVDTSLDVDHESAERSISV